MDNGIQAVSARIARLEQRFVEDSGSTDVDTSSSSSTASSTSLSAGGFASVLAAALGTTALGIDGADSSAGLATAALGIGTSGGGTSALGGGSLAGTAIGSTGLGGSSLADTALASVLGGTTTGSASGTGLTGASGAAALGANQQLTAAVLISLLSAVARGGASTSGAVTSGALGSTTATTTTAVGATGRTPANKLSPGAYPKLTPPAELAAYGNGRIPSERLQSIGVGSHKLYAPAATAYRRMTADAAAQGVKIGITDSYRSYDSQVELAGRKGLYSQGGLAATPGTSNHGWGLAVDLDLDATAQQWMRDHAHEYGFVEDTPREPWHWGYRPAASV